MTRRWLVFGGVLALAAAVLLLTPSPSQAQRWWGGRGVGVSPYGVNFGSAYGPGYTNWSGYPGTYGYGWGYSPWTGYGTGLTTSPGYYGFQPGWYSPNFAYYSNAPTYGYGTGYPMGAYSGFTSGTYGTGYPGYTTGSYGTGYPTGTYGTGYPAGTYSGYATGNYAAPQFGNTYGPAPNMSGGYQYGTVQNQANVARISVQVPADAEIWVEGQRTRETGSVRNFVSPPLTPGRDYSYDIRARWNANGREHNVTKHVDVRAGSQVTVDFGRADEERGTRSNDRFEEDRGRTDRFEDRNAAPQPTDRTDRNAPATRSSTNDRNAAPATTTPRGTAPRNNTNRDTNRNDRNNPPPPEQ